MRYIIRISKDVCGAYADFSNAVSSLIADKIREHCQAFGINDATGISVSLSPFGSNENGTHSIFSLKVWSGDSPNNQQPPLPDVTQPYTTHR